MNSPIKERIAKWIKKNKTQLYVANKIHFSFKDIFCVYVMCITCFTDWATEAPLTFISFSCLIVLVSTMLNRYDIWHFCLISDLREKAFNLSWLGIMLAVGLLYVTFIILSYVPSITNLMMLYHESMLYFSKYFCYIYWVIVWFLPVILLMWHITFIGLCMFEPSSYPKDKSQLIMVYDSIIIFLFYLLFIYYLFYLKSS